MDYFNLNTPFSKNYYVYMLWSIFVIINFIIITTISYHFLYDKSLLFQTSLYIFHSQVFTKKKKNTWKKNVQFKKFQLLSFICLSLTHTRRDRDSTHTHLKKALSNRKLLFPC